MPKIRQVLVACTVEIAQRSRICRRDRKNHSIPRGATCLVIKEAGSAGTKKSYCLTCALAILDQAADDLQTLRAELS
jgi:hypothetical protein